MKIQTGNRGSFVKASVTLGLGLAILPPAEAADFVGAPAMHQARYYHTATLLPDGMVLVAGGGENAPLSDAEIFDSATGRWALTGRLRAARYQHTATLLLTGEVLAAGGFRISSSELYDPASGTWSLTGAMKSARGSHTATLLPSGKVLVAGGGGISGNTLSSAEVYDPVSGAWSSTGAMKSARENHTATLLPNGKVLVTGGNPGAQSAELYDPLTGKWTDAGALSGYFVNHTATLLPNGKVLLAGGFSDGDTTGGYHGAELYDPASGTWTPAAPMNAGREVHSATLLSTGKVLVAGGYGSANGIRAELYDPAAGTWTETATMSYGRFAHTATLLPNGNVLIAAGNDTPPTPNVYSSTEIYESDFDGAAPSLTILRSSNELMTFYWRGVGTLEQSDSLIAPDWQPAPVQDNPLIVAVTGPVKFFRLKFNP